MKKTITMILLIMFSVASMPTVACAGAQKGQNIFKKEFRKKCRFSGVRFARNHTQSEWEEIYDNGSFPQEAKKICPRLNLKKIKASWWEHVYEFSFKYARDGVVPKC